jgi:hypothetical protein
VKLVKGWVMPGQSTSRFAFVALATLSSTSFTLHQGEYFLYLMGAVTQQSNQGPDAVKQKKMS